MKTRGFQGSADIKTIPALNNSFPPPKTMPVSARFLTADENVFTDKKIQKILAGSHFISGYGPKTIKPISLAYDIQPESEDASINDAASGHRGTMKVWKNNSLIIRTFDIPAMTPANIVFITARNTPGSDAAQHKFIQSALLHEFIVNDDFKAAHLPPETEPVPSSNVLKTAKGFLNNLFGIKKSASQHAAKQSLVLND